MILPEPTQPTTLPMQTKKEKRKVWFYGRFLSISIMTTPIIATKTNRPAIAGIKYWSAMLSWGDCVGVIVGAAASTANAVTACDGQ